MKRTALLVGVMCLAGLASAFIEPENVDAFWKFESWRELHGKTYGSPAEQEQAFLNFQASLKRSAARQAAHALSEGPLKQGQQQEPVFGITKFADLSPEEFKAKYLTRIADPDAAEYPVKQRSLIRAQAAAPNKFDWREKGAVSPVKDQGQCGSCWAFSTTESIESQWFLKSGKLHKLSPQQIVDCDTVDAGCRGGDLPSAFAYVSKAGGLEGDSTYPYTSGTTGRAGRCAFKKADVQAQISNFTYGVKPCFDKCDKQYQLEPTMQTNLVNEGPFAICVNAAPWQDYVGGVFSKGCGHGYYDLDHCVQVVGYNLEGAKKYWIVRNSWNTNWGVGGYIYLEFGTNQCGLADEVAFANAL